MYLLTNLFSPWSPNTHANTLLTVWALKRYPSRKVPLTLLGHLMGTPSDCKAPTFHPKAPLHHPPCECPSHPAQTLTFVPNHPSHTTQIPPSSSSDFVTPFWVSVSCSPPHGEAYPVQVQFRLYTELFRKESNGKRRGNRKGKPSGRSELRTAIVGYQYLCF